MSRLEYLFRASGVGVRESAALGNSLYPYVVKLVDLGRHGRLYLRKRLKPHYHSIQHRKQMCEAIKLLYILLSSVF